MPNKWHSGLAKVMSTKKCDKNKCPWPWLAETESVRCRTRLARGPTPDTRQSTVDSRYSQAEIDGVTMIVHLWFLCFIFNIDLLGLTRMLKLHANDNTLIEREITSWYLLLLSSMRRTALSYIYIKGKRKKCCCIMYGNSRGKFVSLMSEKAISW